MRERFYNFPVPNRIVSSAPTRIDLAGGTIDIWPLYLEHEGACTVNAAISLRAHAEIEPRTDGRVELRSIDTNRQQSAARWQDLDARGASTRVLVSMESSTTRPSARASTSACARRLIAAFTVDAPSCER